MTSTPSAAPAPIATGIRATLSRFAAYLEELDGDQFSAQDVRIRRLEHRIAQLEAAAQKEA